MKILLKKLELLIEDEIIEQAELLLEEGRLGQLEEVEKNLWSGLVKAEKEYEVEVKLVQGQIRAFTCDCRKYDRDHFCVHLTAFFLALRKRKNQQTIEKEQKPPPPAAKRLTTNIILKEIREEDLKDFVKTYAQKNRQFAIALKARFASSVSTMDRHEKYIQLIDAAIKAVKRPNRGINTQGIKQLAKLVADLQIQVAETIERKNFQEAFAILSILFKKIAAALRIADGEKKPLLESLEENFPLLEDLLQAQPAPDLEKEIWQFILQAVARAYLKSYQIDRPFLLLGKTLALSISRKKELIQTIEDRLQDAFIEKEEQSFLLINQLDLYNSSGQAAKATKLIQAQLGQPLILLKAIELAQSRKELKEVERLAKIGMALHNKAEIAHQLEEILYQNALSQKKSAAILKWAKKRFLSTFQIEYWQAIKNQSPRQWTRHKSEILERLKQKIFSLKKRDTLAWIYASENEEESLFQYIKETRSLELLMQYDGTFSDKYQSQLFLLYEDFILEYLQQHLGRQTSQKIRKVLLHLQDSGALDFFQRLTKKLRRDFPERHSLMEELADLS